MAGKVSEINVRVVLSFKETIKIKQDFICAMTPLVTLKIITKK